MKTLFLFLLAGGAASAAPSPVQVETIATYGTATGPAAAALIAQLKAAKVQGFEQGRVTQYDLRSGSILITNGGACENGRRTYRFEFDETNEEGTVVQHIQLDGLKECSLNGPVNKLFSTMNIFGGNRVAYECGLGTCEINIPAISCSESKIAKDPYPQTCAVTLSNAALQLKDH
jgi:hypothetical protein